MCFSFFVSSFFYLFSPYKLVLIKERSSLTVFVLWSAVTKIKSRSLLRLLVSSPMAVILILTFFYFYNWNRYSKLLGTKNLWNHKSAPVILNHKLHCIVNMTTTALQCSEKKPVPPDHKPHSRLEIWILSHSGQQLIIFKHPSAAISVIALDMQANKLIALDKSVMNGSP